MVYITGVHALNLKCSLDTCGDWHQSSLNWINPPLRESSASIFGGYGIECNKLIPYNHDLFNVANHIRAILDMLSEGNLSYLRGMRNDFIGESQHVDEMLSLITKLKHTSHWNKIDSLMRKEYMLKWININTNS